VDSKSDEGVTALIMAAKHGHQKVVHALLDAGSDVNIHMLITVTPYHLHTIQ
jgi:ankyrin repeat protein